MKNIQLASFLGMAWFATWISLNCLFAQTVPSDPPTSEPISPKFTVTVNNKDVPVYLARVCSLTPKERKPFSTEDPKNFTNTAYSTESSFTSFEVKAPVEITVTCLEEIRSAVILPSSRGIKPAVNGKTISFSIDKPGQFVLEINGDDIRSLQLFANPPEENIPDPKDPNVIYFAPGIHVIEPMKIGSNKTVYVAEGAFIYGKPSVGPKNADGFLTLDGNHITLRGRGVIDGSLSPRHSHNIICSRNATNVQVEGIILRDSSGWTFPVRSSDHVSIKNIKIFGYRANSDGIDINNSTNVIVADSYLRTFDDLVVIKSSDTKKGETKNVTVRNCVLWNEFAHALSLGAEMRKNVENIVFTDCDIVRDKGREWSMRVFQCDSGYIKNVLFENIRVEECQRLFSLWIGKAVWSKDEERGHIDDITFRNIQSVPSSRPSEVNVQLKGFDAEHAIHDVTFENILIGNKPLRSSDVRKNEFVSDIKVTP